MGFIDSGVDLNGQINPFNSLEKVHSGSTLLLTFDGPTEANSIRPVINLFTLKLDKELDRESKSNYRLDIVLLEKSKPSESKQLNIIVTDVNDNEPKFEADLYRFELVENNPVNINLGRVVAFDRDLDENATLEYFLPVESLVSYNSSGLAETGKNLKSGLIVGCYKTGF